MRITLLTLVVLAVPVLASSGCGTVANFATGEPKVYGGLSQDANFFMKYAPGLMEKRAAPSCAPGSLEERTTYTKDPCEVLVLFGLVVSLIPAELCCSAAADTLTLPITLLLDSDGVRSKPQLTSQKDDSKYPVQYSPIWATSERSRSDSSAGVIAPGLELAGDSNRDLSPVSKPLRP